MTVIMNVIKSRNMALLVLVLIAALGAQARSFQGMGDGVRAHTRASRPFPFNAVSMINVLDYGGTCKRLAFC